MSKTGQKRNEGAERRKVNRRPVLATFSLFVVVPRKGIHRLTVHDVSELGIGFELDTEGEDPALFALKEGEEVDVRFYLNQSLFLPLTAQVARISERGGVRQIGASFVDTSSKGYKAFRSFIDMLDQIIDAIEIESTT